jgi:outer membrane protein OmpA-like peptidoglycan-associated protein
VNTSAWESQPSLSANGRQLFFASDRPGGQGRNDIWVSDRNPDGSWGNPRPLSDSINTAGMDQSPFIHPDGQTLYFMSDGHPGMGQTDLYYSRLRPDGKWGKPQNMGYPINTTANEGALVVGLSGEKAYFATDRADIAGRAPEGRIPYSNIFEFDLYPEARPRPVTYLLVKVLDAQTGAPLLAQADILELEEQTLFASSTTDEKGELLVCLPAGRDYALNVNKEDYLFYSENFALSDSFSLNRPFEVEAALEPVKTTSDEERKPIVLRNVFFETGSAELLPESRGELDRLVLLLEENPDIHIRINGHTDNVGSEEDNLQLSDARAASVLAYLNQAGIAKSRLESKGFGETQPMAPNDTPAGRRLNRRTEFVIVK